jgi:hypothetical protein
VLVVEALVPFHMEVLAEPAEVGGQLVAAERILFLVIWVALAGLVALQLLATQTLLGKVLALDLAQYHDYI